MLTKKQVVEVLAVATSRVWMRESRYRRVKCVADHAAKKGRGGSLNLGLTPQPAPIAFALGYSSHKRAKTRKPATSAWCLKQEVDEITQEVVTTNI